MTARSTRFVLVIFLAMCAWAARAQAPVDVESQVRSVVLAQITALSEDDAEAVFATTTPAVQGAMGSSGRFLAMVRGAYPMVYQPQVVVFHKPEQQTGNDGTTLMLQMVEITDSSEKSWLAIFALEQQPDRSWRIGGCVAVENPWTPV